MELWFVFITIFLAMRERRLGDQLTELTNRKESTNLRDSIAILVLQV